ncbi:MAG: hypothetical protein ABI855_19225, partial [Bacteroidota bacterium]
MKQNLHQFIMQTLICVLFTVCANATTINVTYTNTDTVRACDSSFFTVTFTLAGSQQIIVKDSTNFDTCAHSNCSIAEFATMHVTSSSPPISDFAWDSTSHVWFINLSAGSYTITYRLRLD